MPVVSIDDQSNFVSSYTVIWVSYDKAVVVSNDCTGGV